MKNEDLESAVLIDAELRDIIPQYFENRKEDIVTILECLRKKDFVIIERLGHSMKGSGGGYGLEQVFYFGAALETAAKAREESSIQEIISELDIFLRTLKIVFVDISGT